MDAAIGLGLAALTLYFSALSYALRTYSRARLAERLSESDQRRWFPRLDRNETELQVVTSAIRLTAIVGLMVWVYFEKLVVESQGKIGPRDFVIPSFINLGVLLVFALGIPHSIAQHAGDSLVAASLPLIWVLRYPFYPIEKLLMFLDLIVRRLAGRPEVSREDQTQRMEEEILNAVSEGEIAGAVDEEQKQIITSVFELHETTVSAIMTPRTEIEAVPIDASYEQVRQSILKVGHSRIPVFEKTIDHIVGVVYAKDMLRVQAAEPFDVRKLMRNAPYVPATKTLGELLDEFRRKRVQIAIVLDEYGGTAGLATIEDILEELVGEIDDEYDQPEAPSLRRIDDDTLEVDARVSVSEVNTELGIELPEDGDYETIGGFVFSAIGKIPAAGEQFSHEQIEFRVIAAEPRRINRLRIHVLREASAT
ncbi:MAG: HlyC/CorC family transporter [Planctomycetes bacterium]|nr:HlyC/CorC family transporter [Planctomycetota bacterium]